MYVIAGLGYWVPVLLITDKSFTMCLSKTVLAVTNTVRWVIFGGSNFCGKSEKTLRFNFCGIKFCDSNPNCCANDDRCSRYMLSISLNFLCRYATFAQKKLDQIAWDVEEYLCQRCHHLDDSGDGCLLTLKTVGHASTMFLTLVYNRTHVIIYHRH